MKIASAVFVIAVFAIAGTTSSHIAVAADVAEQVVNVGDYRLLLKVQRGTKVGLPTIVLESGGGADSTQWSSLQPILSAETGATVVSYDRPGFGKSDLPTKPYDIAEESRAFHAALEKLGLAESVLLIGHSYGGLLIQLYAATWPDAVRGLLFLDPNTPAIMLAAGTDGVPGPIKNPSTPRGRALARIDAALNRALVTVYRAQIPLNIPMIVVSAETPPFDKPRLRRVFGLGHDLLAASVIDGKRIVATGTNHMTVSQRPEFVLEGVRELLSKVP